MFDTRDRRSPFTIEIADDTKQPGVQGSFQERSFDHKTRRRLKKDKPLY